LDQVSKSYEAICNYTQKELRWWSNESL
jgi:hypothetical protein